MGNFAGMTAEAINEIPFEWETDRKILLGLLKDIPFRRKTAWI
jgi:hypothetical protein